MNDETPIIDVCVLYVTVPDIQTAKTLATALLEDRLAACVNILPAMTSVYRWEGAIESGEEVSMIVKTTKARAPAARETILRIHPYETPAVLCLSVDPLASSKAFCEWVASETQRPAEDQTPQLA